MNTVWIGLGINMLVQNVAMNCQIHINMLTILITQWASVSVFVPLIAFGNIAGANYATNVIVNCHPLTATVRAVVIVSIGSAEAAIVMINTGDAIIHS